MKTILFVLFILICCKCSFAQITITGNDMPKPGRTNILSYDTIPNIYIGIPSSVFQTWDFSNLANHYTRFATYSPVTVNQQSQNVYTGSEIYTYGPAFWFGMLYGAAPVNISSWGYLFFSSDQQGLKIVGFNSNFQGALNVLENPQELLMGTPASLDSVFNNYSKWELPFNIYPADNVDTIYKKSSLKTLTCDAFGNLITPFDTFEVIRVHEYVSKWDSLRLIFFNTYNFDTLFASDTLNNYYFWAKNVNYPVAIVLADKNNNVLKVEYLTDTVFPAKSITGQVLTTNGPTPITSGTASLKVRSPWDHLFTTYETVNLVNNGHFQFSSMYGDSLIPGNYLIFIDPDSSVFPYNIPTYYGNETHWENATVLHLASDTAVIVRLQNDSAFMYMNGPGNIYGDITFTQAKSYTTNADKIKVVLEEDPGGVTRLHTGIDADGNYDFTGIDTGYYKLRVEIAGLIMDSTYYIHITQQQANFYNHNFIYDTLKIEITDDSYIPENNFFNTGISFYPNPFSSDCILSIEKDATEIYTLNLIIYDITGREIKRFNEKGKNTLIFNRANLKSGIYFVSVLVNGQYSHKGKLIME